ncbi:pyridoxal-phosphate dependent enzyme [Conexibacter sp. W3-3-2]|uniref:1-aminocyclopropane-1-carboxylate deaminase n=1 Tax=Paraconexibacter algicola TaxID=2133960 RepID=A0A2T4UC08_9ACTN|nr:pyridoxal-phosphate dependent enzyme [Conexibacter sp. W3-3-2]PTL54416.1 1-aminocyclopropane-1-carboxylate deaminase [Paraconexibacter algicola]
MRLGSAPTAVRRLDGLAAGGAEVWIKDEGAYGDGGWGGNKVRKLEWLLPDALRRGRDTVVTFGALGTNHGLATALYARDLGLRAAVLVVEQPLDEHVERQFGLLCRSGASVYRTGTKARTAAALPVVLAHHAAASGGRRPYVFPAGGSSPVGVLGTVEAALELAAQVRAGELPEPSHVVCAVGTGGTAAGFALGFALAGLRTRVHAVVVNDTLRLDEPQMLRLARRTSALLRRRGARLGPLLLGRGHVVVDRSELGPGYGVGTEAAGNAIAIGGEHGVHLDPVYTGKAFAALLASARRGRYGRGPVVLLRTHGPRP